MTREEAIKRLQEVKVWAKDDDLTVIDMAIEALKERPTGHWRDDGEMMWCSNCGHGEDAYFGCYDERIDFNGMKGWARRYPAYCKRCGAKMESAVWTGTKLEELQGDNEENDLS